MATPDNKYNVVFNGNGAEDVDPGAPSSVGANNPYYFQAEQAGELRLHRYRRL